MKGMQIKTTLGFHFTPDRLAIIKKTNSGKEPSYTVGGNVNYCNQYGDSSKN
jgi:hypothetical protein